MKKEKKVPGSERKRFYSIHLWTAKVWLSIVGFVSHLFDDVLNFRVC